jgi:hypothetical protein
MKKIGSVLFILGLGSLALSACGLEFRIMRLLSDDTDFPVWALSLVFMFLGVMLYTISFRNQYNNKFYRTYSIAEEKQFLQTELANKENTLEDVLTESLEKGSNPRNLVGFLVHHMGMSRIDAQKVVYGLVEEMKGKTE